MKEVWRTIKEKHLNARKNHRQECRMFDELGEVVRRDYKVYCPYKGKSSNDSIFVKYPAVFDLNEEHRRRCAINYGMLFEDMERIFGNMIN